MTSEEYLSKFRIFPPGKHLYDKSLESHLKSECVYYSGSQMWSSTITADLAQRVSVEQGETSRVSTDLRFEQFEVAN